MSDRNGMKAVLRLVAWQGRGRLRRMGCRFLLPRRMILSLLAVLLAIVWLGNAVMTVWLREPATPELLRAMMGIGLALYAVWHLAMAACFRPPQCLEWIEAEHCILQCCPLCPRELLIYKLASVTTPTLLKTAVLALLLLPDLACVPVALGGILLGMFFLELLRMGVEIAAWGMSQRAFLAFRVIVICALSGLGAAAVATVVESALLQGEMRIGSGVMSQIGQLLIETHSSAAGLVGYLFAPFVNMICTSELTLATMKSSLLAVGMVLFAGTIVFWLYATMPRLVAHREKVAYQPSRQRTGQTEPALILHHRKLRNMVGRLGPVGAIAGRQLIGSRHYAGSLLTAMVIPGCLAMATMFVVATPMDAFLATASALAFYTFLLLPTALRFDFRRDLDRLAMFKSLPVPARAMTAGQLATPVLISTLFQATVLAVAALLHGQSLPLYLGTVLIMVPMNIAVFALENWIFLLYPYRTGQEGLEIFLRTMLIFTGKGLLFVLGLGMISIWGYGAALIARTFSSQLGTVHHGYIIFSVGLLLGLCLVSWGLCIAVRHAYQRINPIEDVPR